jgi:putative ABC transport system ATP-binding protein/lipoprotein-releasing system ATP-binding protein
MSVAATATDTVLVRCEDVARTYGSGPVATVALHGTTCAVPAGAQIAITGPSGSGKSTLLHLMAGLDEPTVGTVSWPAIGSRDVLRPGPLAMVFQGPSLLPPLTSVENVALPLQLEGASEADAREQAHNALRRLGLDDLADKLPEELSGGQAQRVAVARVLAGSPRLILADEPTGQLDRHNADVVVDTLIRVAADHGSALVVATHDEQVAARFATRWSVADGRLTTHAEALR